jgi:predicted esterase
MDEKEVSFQYTARYYTLGKKDNNLRKIWFVLHGYGQLAQYFIRKFKVLADKNIFIIAPEGLSKFYLEDIMSRSLTGNNKVGASWMTRENRERDIKNYIKYLNHVYDLEAAQSNDVEITIFGFSQGAATSSRWLIDNHVKFNRLIVWGGVLPPDMDFNKGKELLKNKTVIEVVGKSDPFLTDERLKEMTTINERLGIHPKLISFEGGHEINSEILESLI